MTILALEFSSSQRSVAVLSAATPTADQAVAEVVETGAGFTRAFGMIDEALRAAGRDRREIDCIAVGLGPGSYHGIRVGISVAQGWELVRPVRLQGISSADCIAAEAHAQGVRGALGVVIDAQRGECYVAGYELEEQGWRVSEPLRLAAGAELTEFGRRMETIAGPEATRWFERARVLWPRAAALGQLASSRNQFVPGEKLEPIYLRQTTFVKAPPPRVPAE